MRIDEESIIGDILDRDPACQEILLSMGLACMGCPAARGETVREACDIHDIDAGVLLQKLSRHFNPATKDQR